MVYFANLCVNRRNGLCDVARHVSAQLRGFLISLILTKYPHFCPEMVYFANLRVNLRDRLCGVARHASAQSLDCLDIDEISSFLKWSISPISASICGIACATWHATSPRNPTDCLDLDEISSFLNWKRTYVTNRLMDGHWLGVCV